MKKLSIIMIGLSIITTQAQDINDAVRLAQSNINGTARYSAMGGAFGALGGDLSAISINPASSAIFINNQATVSLANFNKSNDSNYFGRNTSENKNTLDISQAGGVFVFDNYNKKDDWNKFVFAINYENDNFSNKLFSAGTNPTNSVANYFLYYANAHNGNNGIRKDALDNYYYDELDFADQQAYLGYWGYVINPLVNTDTNTVYTNGVRPGGNYYQENSVSSVGYNSKVSLNGSAQYQNWLSIGLNLNFNSTDYRQTSKFYESNNNPLDATTMVSSVRFNNEFYTYGTGFSFQLGAIAKASKEVRFGLSYQSPTWFHLNDEFVQDLSATRKNTSGTLPTDIVNPRVINIYEPYTLRTPSKLTGSFAYIFGKRGLFSLDYGIKKYSGTQFGPNSQFTNPAANNTNNDIKNALTTAKEIKLGGEIKLKQWSIRGGYRFEESPYKNKDVMGDLKGYSTGLGYSWGDTKLDLAYSTSSRDSQQSFFNQGLTDAAKMTTVKDVITATLVFEF